MDTFFTPKTLVIYGLSGKPNNTPRIIVENCLRWGFRGRIFGVNPATPETQAGGIALFRQATDLPVTADLAVLLIPAKYVPAAVADCAKAGIKRLAIQAGGFNESSAEGQQLAAELLRLTRLYDLRFVGPNGLTLANTASGLCLPFVPAYPVKRGGFSLITQSGGLGLFLWNLLESEQVGLAKFVSIGNKLNLDENDFLEYLGNDPETKVIGMYLESIVDGRRLIRLAEQTDKPIIIYKANTTQAGHKAAMSHTAALSNNDAVMDTAFERAGIIRIDHFRDFITTAKAFDLPPMRGKRIMAMSPAGGLAVAMADLCERQGLAFADPGEDFYASLKEITNAGIIKLSNPLDMGDMYRIDQYPALFAHVLASDQVDGAVYVSQWPKMPEGGQDVFTAMFNTDIALETTAAIRSAAKPLAVALYGHQPSLLAMKRTLPIPIFDGPEEAICALKRQMCFHAHKAQTRPKPECLAGGNRPAAEHWLQQRQGAIGEEALELLALYGINSPQAGFAHDRAKAMRVAGELGYPVALKLVCADALHKSEAGGVMLGLGSADEVAQAFDRIRANLHHWNQAAVMEGVRVVAMAPGGEDLFIGGLQDPSFGPVVLFGLGGIFVEAFNDVAQLLCPASASEIESTLCRLKAYPLLAGARGRKPVVLAPFIQAVQAVSQLLADCPGIAELDLNPLRILADGQILALDARLRIQQP